MKSLQPHAGNRTLRQIFACASFGGWGYSPGLEVHALDRAPGRLHGQHLDQGRPAITTGSSSTKCTPSTWCVASYTRHGGRRSPRVARRPFAGLAHREVLQLDQAHAHAFDLVHGQPHQSHQAAIRTGSTSTRAGGRSPWAAPRPGARRRPGAGLAHREALQRDQAHRPAISTGSSSTRRRPWPPRGAAAPPRAGP